MVAPASEMGPTAIDRIDTNYSPTTTCLFLDKLPPEIREMVYRRLLMQEIDIRSAMVCSRSP